MTVFIKFILAYFITAPLAQAQMMSPMMQQQMMQQQMMNQQMMGNPWNQAQINQHLQMQGASMGGPGNCLGMLAQNFSQSLSSTYQARSERNNMLMEQATNRFEHLKSCRQELLSGMIEFEQAKLKHQQNIDSMQMKMKRAELEYKTQVLEIEKECRANANDEFQKYRENIYKRQVIDDPTMLAGFNRRINSHQEVFFQGCHRDRTNVKMIGLAGDSYRLAINELETELQNSRSALESMELQTQKIQRNTLKNCEDQEKLNAYNEALARQNAEEAISLAQTQAALGAFGAIMSCVDPGNRQPTGSNPDTTRGRNTPQRL